MKIFSETAKELIINASLNGGEVFLSKELVSDIRDCMNRKLEVDIEGPYRLVFVNPTVAANWAHTCYYILTNKKQECRCIEHDWPPASSIILER